MYYSTVYHIDYYSCVILTFYFNILMYYAWQLILINNILAYYPLNYFYSLIFWHNIPHRPPQIILFHNILVSYVTSSKMVNCFYRHGLQIYVIWRHSPPLKLCKLQGVQVLFNYRNWFIDQTNPRWSIDLWMWPKPAWRTSRKVWQIITPTERKVTKKLWNFKHCWQDQSIKHRKIYIRTFLQKHCDHKYYWLVMCIWIS